MFLKVKASDITMILNLGTDLAQASDVIKMFENNAQFIRENYSSAELVKAEQSIDLGSKIEYNKSSYDSTITNLVITAESLDVGFVMAENYTFADLDKTQKEYKAKIAELKKEIDYLSSKNKALEIENEELKEANEQG